ARAHGVDLQHVKPHGALYNVAARDPRTALAIARAVARFSKDLVLVGLAGSALVAAGREMGLPVAEEVFADRRYEPDGSLRSRRLPDAVLHDPQQAAAQALRLAQEGAVVASTGEVVRVRADTICLHGDTPGAVAIAQAVAAALRAAGVELVPVGALVRR
ncbi:MAG TPA: LamB/YcsF family protein, partial [Chloroflexota bacterium]